MPGSDELICAGGVDVEQLPGHRGRGWNTAGTRDGLAPQRRESAEQHQDSEPQHG